MFGIAIRGVIALFCNQKLWKMRIIKDGNPEECALYAVLKSLDEFLEEGVFQCAADKNVIFANGPFLKMFGFVQLREIHGTPCVDLYADDEAMVYLMDKLRLEGSITKYRILCRKKDGSNFWGLVSGRKVLREQRILYEIVISDISSQIKAEDDLKDKEVQLEKLTMELDRFIYSASHEIRSPVSTLLGIINLMKHDLKDDPAQQYIQMLCTGIDKLDQIVRQLTVHVKNAKNRVDNKCIDFDAVVRDILDEFSQTHAAFSLVSSRYEVMSSGVFYCDPDRLRLILLNVIKNAFDYTDRRKSDRVLSIVIQIRPEKAMIEIFDNGIGIASGHVAKVFDMFYRATNLAKGSGIGLYTVREMVTKMGGIISLESEYGIGTSVRIELPNSKTGKLINRKKLLRAVKK